MFSILKAPVIVIGFSLVSIPGLVSGQSTPPPVTEVWATRGPTDAPFAHISDAVAASPRYIFVADEVNQMLYRYDLVSNSFARWGKTGEGPGELQTPTLLSLTRDGEVALYDIGHGRILFFDTELQPTGSVRMEELIINPKGFLMLGDRGYLLSGGRMRVARGGDGKGVHHFDAQGELVRSYIDLPEHTDHRAVMFTAGGSLNWAGDDQRILFTNSAPHRIAMFTPEMHVSEIASDTTAVPPILDDFVTTGEFKGREVRRYRWYYAQSRGVFPLESGNILNIITREYEGDSFWEVWSKDGDLLRRLQVPVAYRPVGRTSAGHVVAVKKDPATDEQILVGLEFRGLGVTKH